MPKKKQIILDVDGVLLDFITPFCEWLSTNRRFGDFYLDPFDVRQYDMTEYLPRNTSMRELLYQFFSGNPSLPPLMSPEHLEVAKNYGIELHVITSGSAFNTMMKLWRVQNLTRCYGAVFNSIQFHQDGPEYPVKKWERLRDCKALDTDIQCVVIEDHPDIINALNNWEPGYCAAVVHDYNIGAINYDKTRHFSYSAGDVFKDVLYRLID